MRAVVLLVGIVMGLSAAPQAQAGGKNFLAHTVVARMLARDAARDAAKASVPLANGRTVYRYVTSRQGAREATKGIAANSHFTSRASQGRPLGAAGAQRRFGLPQEPQKRMTVRLPKNTDVRFNKVIGGKPGYGEITVVKPLPRQSISDARQLH